MAKEVVAGVGVGVTLEKMKTMMTKSIVAPKSSSTMKFGSSRRQLRKRMKILPRLPMWLSRRALSMLWPR